MNILREPHCTGISRIALILSVFVLSVGRAFAAVHSVPATALPVPAPGIPSSPANWAQTLERIASGVVTIQIDSTRAFDTEWNTTAQATGFVIDAKRGLILTNRHVVTPGPVTAQAIFLNREEVQLYPVYRDPIHDFGIYRYDPSKLKFIQPAELPLYPAGAVIGREIRVVGNDAGEQLSILSGTLARLDREAPEYGYGKYNDFNTFYFQAASGTSGGSSGSPVIDIEGRVVALNAGGATGAASSFYLPLPAVTRALKYIDAGKPVPRGTLETVFKYTPYDELRRLGLNPDTESRMRSAYPKLTGMLVVDDAQPGSGAEGVLAPGDILVAIDGKPIPEFFALEDVLDSHVGLKVNVEVQRGRETLQHTLDVQSLSAITADEYIEFGEAVVHTLSYQQARHFNVPIRGVYVANPGYAFGSAGIPRAALISSFNGKKIDDLKDFEAVLSELPDGASAPVRYVTLEDPRAAQLKVMRMDRRWFPARKCRRDDALGTWPCVSISQGFSAASVSPASTQFAKTGDVRIDRLAPSLVMVNFDMPYSVSGVTEKNYHGTGVVVDAERGLVAIDRNTVPIAMGDVRITFAGTIEVPGKVVFIHPLHNLAVVAYDPKSIGTTPVRAATLLTRQLGPGADVWVVGQRADSKILSQKTQVSSVDVVSFPLSRTLRFRDSNLEALSLINPPSDYDGVLADERGNVLALWSSFAFETQRELEQVNRGMPAELVSEMIAVVANGRPLYSFEAEFNVQSLASARQLGLPDEWVRRFEEHNPQRRQVLGVDRLVAGTPAAAMLVPGDLLLAVDGKVVNRFREVERAVQKPDVKVSVWRDGAEKTLEMKTVALDGRDVDRVLIWAGATLQAPHRAMSAQRGIAPYGVFVSFFFYGSPATHYGLYAGRRITEVDGQPTGDLDSFIKAVSGKPDRASLRLKTVSWNGQTDVITLKLDKHYWPAYELDRQKDGSWIRTALDSPQVTASVAP
ncbi:MAG TPA: trypsin-like peptidase domain-containing protein [Steroidobacteraceae bacterium]|nr:trypsin-like peptidase domain-containing protein [Steroidobacteraceae bacterium]